MGEVELSQTRDPFGYVSALLVRSLGERLDIETRDMLGVAWSPTVKAPDDTEREAPEPAPYPCAYVIVQGQTEEQDTSWQRLAIEVQVQLLADLLTDEGETDHYRLRKLVWNWIVEDDGMRPSADLGEIQGMSLDLDISDDGIATTTFSINTSFDLFDYY